MFLFLRNSQHVGAGFPRPEQDDDTFAFDDGARRPRPYVLRTCYTVVMNSRVGSVAQLLFVDLLGSIAWFPVWWYTKGLVKVANYALMTLRYRAKAYSFVIWLKNFFVPMYGQHDIAGRLVSVFMRFVVLVGRSVAIVVEALLYVVGLIAWLALPVVAILFLLANIAGGLSVTG